jgi:[pyruvate, water dikinase]-phosphate phosphotransferase / [pyruvate, water dikinase] kinase
MQRTIFFLSDRTGITAETLGRTLLSQFEQVQFHQKVRPFIDTHQKAQKVVKEINEIFQTTQQKALVFATLVDPAIRKIIAQSNGILIDFFSTFISTIEQELNSHSSYQIGRSHAITDNQNYNHRIDAIHYAMQSDDGVNNQQYEQSDLILVGVSRCGKTPTSLYLALQFGIFVANYPFTEEVLRHEQLPTALLPHRSKLFGLTIDVDRLHIIRQERRPNSQYASRKQCEWELQEVEHLFAKQKIKYLNTTNRSIEEIATKILQQKRINRRLF